MVQIGIMAKKITMIILVKFYLNYIYIKKKQTKSGNGADACHGDAQVDITAQSVGPQIRRPELLKLRK
jgi:hypothetical protein